MSSCTNSMAFVATARVVDSRRDGEAMGKPWTSRNNHEDGVVPLPPEGLRGLGPISVSPFVDADRESPPPRLAISSQSPLSKCHVIGAWCDKVLANR